MKIIKIAIITVSFFISSCSTSGGIYKKDDPQHGEFSVGRTLLSVIGAIGTAALIKNGSNSYYDPDYSASWLSNDVPFNDPSIIRNDDAVSEEKNEKDMSKEGFD